MDRFSAIRAFCQAVEDEGFAPAARTLGLSRSQVSKLVMGLEDELGVQLLNRTTRQISPTPAGQAYYERMRGVLADMAEAEASLLDGQEEPQGELRINAPLSFGALHLGPALAEFMARYPKIRVELSLTDRFVDPVAEGFDLTVRIAEPAEMNSLIDHRLVEARRVICASPDFIKRHSVPSDANALQDLPALHYGSLRGGHSWRLIRDGVSVQAKVTPVLASDNAEVLREAAMKGLGIALLPVFIVNDALARGELVPVLSDYAPPAIYITLLYPPNRHLSQRLRVLIEFLQDRFTEEACWRVEGGPTI